jgi:sigma-B regulation protein RsbU (phosphoserine phosphatase)
MSTPTQEKLLSRIAELEVELKEREADLKRFRDELSKANSRLETLINQLDGELKMAHSIQKLMVPTEFPHINGFEFSTKFVPSHIAGGDYFDIFEHDDRFRFGVIVASSSGHTMSALLLSVLLRMTGQLEARKGSEPHQVLKEMALQLNENLTEVDSADIFYSLIDRRNFDMRFIKAGELVALHHSYVANEVKALDSGLGPMTKTFAPPLQSGSLLLNPRDRLVLCTRGVIEAVNSQGEKYGMERVTRSFLNGPKRGVHELRNHILYEVQKFSGSKEPSRDQTIVVLEVKDKVIKLAKS